jgi:glycine/D-amino acid oxidase-like deaminating enzyme
MGTAATWYEATAVRGDAHPPLAGRAEADVCVIGGGLAGITSALELAKRGKCVVLLEADRLAWGASGRNGGFVSSGFAEGTEEIERKVGLDAAKSLHRLSQHGTEYVRRKISELGHGIKTGDGKLVVLRHSDADGLARHRDHMAAHYSEQMELIDAAETRARVPSLRYYQSLYSASGFHIHPLRYALKLADQAAKAGVSIHESTKALAISREGSGFEVVAGAGRIKAAHVLVCVSALDRPLHRATGRAVLPVATYVAVTVAGAGAFIPARHSVSDTRRAGNYFRVVDEERLLWGGAITTRVSEPLRLAMRMKRDMVSVFPQMGDPAIDYAWAGLMGYARHKMPLIGQDKDGIWYATAFGGHGLNTTAMAGLLLSRAIADKDDEFRRFQAYQPIWTGGPFGRAGVQSAYWWMQLKDRLDERSHAPN